MAEAGTDSPKLDHDSESSQDGSCNFLLGKISPTLEKNIVQGSSNLPIGCPPITFKPPVHRKHDRAHCGKSKGSHKRPPRMAYPDVPLRLLGSQSDIDSPEAHISPTHSTPISLQRRSDTSIEQQQNDSIENTQHEDQELEEDIDHLHMGNGVKRDKKSSSNTVVMTGTIKRGKNQDIVNVNLSKDEMDALTRSTLMDKDKSTGSKCGLRMGPHILSMSILYIPFAFLSSLFVSFYTGSMCWYNIYIYLSEEKTLAHKLLLCPLLIIFYPFLIVLFSFGIAFYAAVVQLSWYFSSWFKEIKDLDKNCFGCLCDKIRLPQCSPYEVVIIEDDILGNIIGGSEPLGENEMGTNGIEMGVLSEHQEDNGTQIAEAIVINDAEANCMDDGKINNDDVFDNVEHDVNINVEHNNEQEVDINIKQNNEQEVDINIEHNNEQEVDINIEHNNEQEVKINIEETPIEDVITSEYEMENSDTDDIEISLNEKDIFLENPIHELLIMQSIEEEDEEEAEDSWYTAQRDGMVKHQDNELGDNTGRNGKK